MDTRETLVEILVECEYALAEWKDVSDSPEKVRWTGVLTKQRDALIAAIDALDKVAEWVPMVNGDPLPPKDTHVLVTYCYKGGTISVMEAVHRINGWWESTGEGLDLNVQVIAWMPLPAPFKAIGEKK